MGRVINFVYGALIILVALDALLNFGFLGNLLGYVVLALGVLVLFTSIGKPSAVGMSYVRPTSSWSTFIRRWVFGAVMVLMGLSSAFGILGAQLPLLNVYSSLGQFILLGIGVIYFLASFARTRNIAIQGV